MKHILVACLCSAILFLGCKEEKKAPETVVEAPKKEQSIAEKIAMANGFEAWKDINNITFTFNVDRNDSHFERTWSWAPKTNDVVFMTREDTIQYNRKKVDSVLAKTDAGFINDKFWLLAPYQLVWDQDNYTTDYQQSVTAPLSKETMQKLTVVYGNEGGYTPGDAYDYYFGDDYILKEWAFRKANQEAPNMITTWADYKSFKGLNISTMHERHDEDFKLYFTGIVVQ